MDRHATLDQRPVIILPLMIYWVTFRSANLESFIFHIFFILSVLYVDYFSF